MCADCSRRKSGGACMVNDVTPDDQLKREVQGRCNDAKVVSGDGTVLLMSTKVKIGGVWSWGWKNKTRR